MRRSHSSRALVLALALLLAAAVPTVSAASASAAAPAPAAGSPPQSVPTQTGPAANGGPAVSRSVLLVLGAAALVASAGAIRQERRSPRAITHGRVVRRPRREVGARTYRVARRVGFRYSQSRDALVLRAVGNRIGPVLRQRPEPALPHGASPAAAPAPAPSPEPVEHVVDLACLPLPSTKHGRLWQLTAVDADSGYTWAELTRPRGAAPSPEQALAFVQQIEAQLKTRGLQLDAVVVQAGSTHRRVLTSAVEQAGVRVLRTLPRSPRVPVAAQRHQEIATAYWDHVLASSGAPPLDLLERQLQRWIAVGNEAAGVGGAPGRDDARHAPAAERVSSVDALGDAILRQRPRPRTPAARAPDRG